MLALFSAAAILALSIRSILLDGTVANQRQRIANLEQRLCQVEAFQRAESRRSVACN